jgi:hypothetical protein
MGEKWSVGDGTCLDSLVLFYTLIFIKGTVSFRYLCNGQDLDELLMLKIRIQCRSWVVCHHGLIGMSGKL